MPAIVCPYCFARMRSHQLQFRCLQSPRTRSGQPCPAEPDLKLTAFQGLPAPALLGPVFQAPAHRAARPARHAAWSPPNGCALNATTTFPAATPA